MTKCAVVTCKGSKSPDKRIMLHRFPKEVSLQTKWVKSCGRVDSINVSTGESIIFYYTLLFILYLCNYNYSETICCRHFHSSDYFKPLIQKILGYSPKSSQKLKVNAVPSLKVVFFTFIIIQIYVFCLYCLK